MKVTPTELAGVLVIEPVVHRDARGFFVESYHEQRYREAGVDATFVQDNHSRSVKGTLRGLHWQEGAHPQSKLVRVIAGQIFDVAVDVKRGSATFGRWVGFYLGADDFKQVFVPPGYAHGFCVLSDVAEVEYKCSTFYDPASERGLSWNDPTVGIKWPISNPVLSERDKNHPTLDRLK